LAVTIAVNQTGNPIDTIWRRMGRRSQQQSFNWGGCLWRSRHQNRRQNFSNPSLANNGLYCMGSRGSRTYRF